MLFARKKDGKLRFFVDYRKLNELTIKDSYLLPRMDECIDSLCEAKVFKTLDAYSGYWQIPIRKEDKAKTAFVCHAGDYKYADMPFGVTNESASFQRALDMILTQYKWQTFLVYIDDFIVYLTTVEEHIRHVDEILTVLKKEGVTLNISRCTFFSDKIDYLGHVIRQGEIHIDDTNTKSLRSAKPPTNKSELRSFLGLYNVYRRFIDNLAKTAHPLHLLFRKGSPEKF